MNSVKEIFFELKKFSSDIIELNPPVEIELVRSFEMKHHLSLPNDYKELLQYTNGFSLMGSGVLGLSSDVKKDSLESNYQFEHYEVDNPQPNYLVPFHNDGRGNFYCFDTRTTDQTSCKIVFWQWDIDYSLGEPELVNNSLIEWIKEVVIDWTLEDYDYDGNEK